MYIVIVGVVLLLLAGGLAYYVASSVTGGKAQSAKVEEPGILYQIGDPKDGLIVNIGTRYVKTSIVVEMRPSKNSKAESKEGKGLNMEEVKMSDAVVRVLRSQKTEDFEAVRQNALKEKLKAEVNAALGEDRVMHVYITNIVLQ
jgi:flagellar FliL protein